jgi:nucleotide-binding universal stress UspA family protein
MKMLVCSIGSRTRAATLRFASLVALALRAETTLLGVVGKAKVERLRQDLDTACHELSGHGLKSEFRVEVGSAEKLVLDELDRSSYNLIAIGALGGLRSRGVPFNSVGMRIVERAQSSVLIVKGNRPTLQRVLICASGTEQGFLPIRAGSALACGAGAEATLLHVVDAMPAMYAGLERMEETLVELLRTDTDVSRSLRWASHVVKEECEISELKLRRGYVLDEILRESEVGDHDLIVLGSSRSATGLVRAFMGDLTREVVQHSERPVLVVRPGG